MLEARYFRDYKHNYMILRCGQQTGTSYQCRLLTSGQIEGILRCSLRHVNGGSYFYYDISSRTTLEGMYRDRQMSGQQVKELLEQLYKIYCRLGDCFMEESGLVLLPEFIYYDLSRKQYVGLYYPDYEADRPYDALMDFLLEHLDGRDDRLANCIYTIYERMEESSFSLRDALKLLEEDGGETQERKTGEIVAFPSESADFKEQEGTTAFASTFSVEFAKDEGDVLLAEEETSSPGKKINLFHPMLSLVSILGIIGITYIYGSYDLSEQEIMILLGCGALLAVCLLAGVIGTVKNGVREIETKGKEGNEKAFAEEERLYPLQQAPVSLEQVLSRQMDFGPTELTKNAAPQISLQKREEEEDYAETVFFDSTRTIEYKLYALDKKNKRHIELNKFPYTVGKMAGCVDCVLADHSVSRIHARFEKAGDRVMLTDMNSTNGTYRNGLRMQPQETVEIEPGDEIRFGNLNYCFR